MLTFFALSSAVKGYIRKSHVLFAMKDFSKALAAIELVRSPSDELPYIFLTSIVLSAVMTGRRERHDSIPHFRDHFPNAQDHFRGCRIPSRRDGRTNVRSSDEGSRSTRDHEGPRVPEYPESGTTGPSEFAESHERREDQEEGRGVGTSCEFFSLSDPRTPNRGRSLTWTRCLSLNRVLSRLDDLERSGDSLQRLYDKPSFVSQYRPLLVS